MKNLALALTCCLLLASVSSRAEVQYCPNPPDCSAQYGSCWADNEGKNCSAQTCAAYCEQQYRDCLYGQITSTTVDYPIVSMTGGECYLGCTGNYCQWNPWDYLSGYDRYDTTYLERHSDHHICADGYEYDDVYGWQLQDTCWQYDRGCYDAKFQEYCYSAPYYDRDSRCIEPPHQDLSSACFIHGSQVSAFPY